MQFSSFTQDLAPIQPMLGCIQWHIVGASAAIECVHEPDKSVFMCGFILSISISTLLLFVCDLYTYTICLKLCDATVFRVYYSHRQLNISQAASAFNLKRKIIRPQFVEHGIIYKTVHMCLHISLASACGTNARTKRFLSYRCISRIQLGNIGPLVHAVGIISIARGSKEQGSLGRN